MDIQRRAFLQGLAGMAGTAFLASCSAPARSDRLGKLLPMRRLGGREAGAEVTCLGLGGYHIGWTSEELAAATIEAALEEGVRFFDTAESYGPHTSEERYGRYLTPRYRDLVFLMTKSMAKTGAEARAHLEGSLRRLKTDQVDLWQIHSLFTPEDTEARLEAGVLEEALQAQKEGKIRFLGFTGHASPYALLRMLERTQDRGEVFLTAQFPVSPVDAASRHSFVAQVMPAARAKGITPLAMKTLADGRFFARKTVGEKVVWEAERAVVPEALSIEQCIHFALSLPVGVVITGAEKPDFLREKAAFARSFGGLGEEGRLALAARAADFAAEGRVEYYKNKELRT